MQKSSNKANSRTQQRWNDAKREMLLNNLYLRGQTKNYLIKKGQGLIDCKHDSRNRFKCVQLNSTEWYVWCSDDQDYINDGISDLWMSYQNSNKYKRQKLSVITHYCNCSFCVWDGLPCRHMMEFMFGLVEISMVDIRFLKDYNVQYRDDSELGMCFAIIKYSFIYL